MTDVQRRPVDYPQEHIPSQHQWYAGRWDAQHKIPTNATEQSYDPERRVVMYHLAGEQFEVPALTPPPWSWRRK